MYDPFSRWETTGTWADHRSYSAGGIDKPLPFDTALPAPASGTLRTSGGSGEFRAGLVGTAGRRSILMLDTPILNLVAIVFQHQSAFGAEKHYEERETLGRSGASTIRNNGTVNEWGGDVHLHDHGLTALGTRVDWRGYIPFAGGSSVASGNKTPVPKLYIPQGEEDMTAPIYAKGHKDPTVYALYVNAGDANSSNGFAGAVYSGRRKVSAGEFAIVEKLGFPHEKQTMGVITIPQGDFDKINKLAGSE